MLKILYAAGNNQNASIQLERFLQAVQGKPYTVKIAAYKQSSPKGVSVDWTLDCLLNMFKPEYVTIEDNDNLQIYYQQIKYFNPDLIISDLEYFTSYIANVLNVTLWQCSSSIINYALVNKQKYNLGLFKHHAYTFNKNPLAVQRTINILDNSNVCYVYSHFGDAAISLSLKEGYEWIRPYHEIGKSTIPCQHNIVAGLLKNNKRILNILQHSFDSVAFSNFPYEQYENILLKPLSNREEYFCNLRNCNLFICEGQTSFLADAFYNGKHTAVFTDFKDSECIINSYMSSNLGLSTQVHSLEDLKNIQPKQVEPSYNPGIKYLHEKIEEL